VSSNPTHGAFKAHFLLIFGKSHALIVGDMTEPVSKWLRIDFLISSIEGLWVQIPSLPSSTREFERRLDLSVGSPGEIRTLGFADVQVFSVARMVDLNPFGY
jgi:hypothetical protein